MKELKPNFELIKEIFESNNVYITPFIDIYTAHPYSDTIIKQLKTQPELSQLSAIVLKDIAHIIYLSGIDYHCGDFNYEGVLPEAIEEIAKTTNEKLKSINQTWQEMEVQLLNSLHLFLKNPRKKIELAISTNTEKVIINSDIILDSILHVLLQEYIYQFASEEIQEVSELNEPDINSFNDYRHFRLKQREIKNIISTNIEYAHSWEEYFLSKYEEHINKISPNKRGRKRKNSNIAPIISLLRTYFQLNTQFKAKGENSLSNKQANLIYHILASLNIYRVNADYYAEGSIKQIYKNHCAKN